MNVAKQRNGPTGAIEVAFIEDIATFQNLSKADAFQPPNFYDEEEDS